MLGAPRVRALAKFPRPHRRVPCAPPRTSPFAPAQQFDPRFDLEAQDGVAEFKLPKKGQFDDDNIDSDDVSPAAAC